jgi:hypothetical protein
MNDDSRVLISEELVGQLQGLEENEPSDLINELVLFFVEDEKTKYEISGHLKFIQFSDRPEIEMNCSIFKALEIYRLKQDLEFDSIKIAHKNILSKIDGPFHIDIINISNINPDEQICMIGIKFKKESHPVI